MNTGYDPEDDEGAEFEYESETGEILADTFIRLAENMQYEGYDMPEIVYGLQSSALDLAAQFAEKPRLESIKEDALTDTFTAFADDLICKGYAVLDIIYGLQYAAMDMTACLIAERDCNNENNA